MAWERPIYGQISTTGAKPFIVSCKYHPDPNDGRVLTSKFYDRGFRPDYEVPMRITKIPVLKGTAVQMNRPLYNQRTIEIGDGLFLSKQDYMNFSLMYHVNLIGEPDPYPTEFLVLREEYLTLQTPTGKKIRVTMEETPTAEGVMLNRGEWVYKLRCKFRFAPFEDEQEELT